MAYRKVKELAVATGSYTDGAGVQKNRYMNVGSILKGDDGQIIVMLSRAFNPAGVPFRPDKPEQVLISVFEPRDPNAPRGAAAPTGAPAASAPADSSLDDDIPF